MSLPGTGQPLNPYGDAAKQYVAVGWRGVIPVDLNGTRSVPEGVTGRAGIDPTEEQIDEWTTTHRSNNLGIRLPARHVALDVDHGYDGKRGGDTIAELEKTLGPLPVGPMSSSRGYGISGIRPFRVPADFDTSGLGNIGTDVEIIHRGWRWIRAWPSLSVKAGNEGAPYFWYGSTGTRLQLPPRPTDFPELPQPWLDYLRSRAKQKRETKDFGEAEFFEMPTWLLEKLKEHEEQTQDGTQRYKLSQNLAYMCAEKGLTKAQTAYALSQHAPTVAKLNDEHNGYLKSPSAQAYVLNTITEAFTKHHHEGRTCKDADCPEYIKITNPPQTDWEEEFWTARPELAHVRTFARSRLSSPWTVLGNVLARVVTSCEPSLVLPPTVGTICSLNLFVGIVGPSGAGKGIAIGVANDAFLWETVIKTEKPGSGEGLAHSYMRRPRASRIDPHPEIEQHTTSVLFNVSEIDSFEAVTRRNGATLMPELRSAYMGEQLGFAYADPGKRMPVPQHKYRLCLVAGIQPARAGVLINDSDGGTPQRFVWLPAIDPGAPDELPNEPLPIPWTNPYTLTPLEMNDEGKVRISEYQHVPVCETAKKVIIEDRKERMRRVNGDLDVHALLTRLKVAAALGLLNGHIEVSDEDWRLAGFVMRKSDETRTYVVSELSKKAQTENESRGRADGARESAKAEVVDRERLRKLMDRLLKLLTNEWIASNTLKKKLRSTEREYFDEALEHLEVQNKVESKNIEHNRGQGRAYRLVSS